MGPAPSKPVLEGGYEVVEELCRGAFGNVVKVKRNTDGRLFALKKITLRDASALEMARKEIQIIQKLRHPNLVRFEEATFDSGENCACVVMEYCDGAHSVLFFANRAAAGDLAELILHVKNIRERVSEAFILTIAEQILKGLMYLHRDDRDIKPQNILVDTSGGTNIQLKIAVVSRSRSCFDVDVDADAILYILNEIE